LRGPATKNDEADARAANPFVYPGIRSAYLPLLGAAR